MRIFSGRKENSFLQAHAAKGRSAIAMNKFMRKFYSCLLILALIFSQGIGLAAVNPSSLGGPKPQYVDLTGAPASGYQLFWYVAGSTSTKQNTYTDATGLTANTNPVVLNSLGEPANGIFFQAGLTYKAVLASPTDTDPPTSPIWTIDGIKGINDTTVTQSQWVAGPAPTFVSGTSFTLAGDQTSTFITGLRLQIVDAVNTKYATVSTAEYNGTTLTTVTTVNDGGLTLQTPLSAVSYGLLSPANISIPRFIQAGTNITVTYDTSGRPVINTNVHVIPRNFIAGCTLSPSGSSMGISACQVTDSTQVALVNEAAITKTTGAWVAGNNSGGIDTGAIANATWYHWYVISNAAGSLVDVIFSLSASAPALPGGYTLYRYIGSSLTNGSAQWVPFTQYGSEFYWSTPVLESTSANPGTSAVTQTLANVPTGLKVRAIMNALMNNQTTNSALPYISSLDTADVAPSLTAAPLGSVGVTGNAINPIAAQVTVWTNTTAQIRTRLALSGASDKLSIATLGWIDLRGTNL